MNTRKNIRWLVILVTLLALLLPGVLLAQEEEPTCEVVPPDGWVVYVVQEGDTLYDLAIQSVSSVDELIAVNCLDDSGVIFVGQELYLPVDPTESTTPFGFTLRCRAQGISMEDCRQIAFGSDSGQGLMNHCQAAGLTEEECGRVTYGMEDVEGLAERCRAEGIDSARCMHLQNALAADDDPDAADDDKLSPLLERCRAAGNSEDICKQLVYGKPVADDDSSDDVVDDSALPSGDQTRDQLQDQTQDQLQDQKHDGSCDNDCDGTGDQIRDGYDDDHDDSGHGGGRNN